MIESTLLETARAAARAAAEVHRTHLRSFGVDRWSSKGHMDFVTHVDHEAEAVVKETIRRSFPEHQILAEESADPRLLHGHEWLWVVDPLDGTTNYLHAYPMYAASVAVLRRGTPVAGVVLNSASGEEWHAVQGGGAFCNGEPIRVSRIDSLAHALVGTGFPSRTQERIPPYIAQFVEVLRATSGVRRAGAAAIDLCHVAAGSLDGFWETSLAPWDVAAGALVLREAGGLITRLDGTDDVIGQGSIIAGNPAIYAALFALLGGTRQD